MAIFKLAQAPGVQAQPLPASSDWWTWPTATYYASAAEAVALGIPAEYPCYIRHYAWSTVAVLQEAMQLRGASGINAVAPTWERRRHGGTTSSWVQTRS